VRRHVAVIRYEYSLPVVQHRARWRLLRGVIAFAASWAVRQSNSAARCSVPPRARLRRARPPPRREEHHRAFQKAKPSVVYIDTRAGCSIPWDAERVQRSEGDGSDSFWDERGDIVTNFHVVEGAWKRALRLADGDGFNGHAELARAPRTILAS